MTEIKIRGIAQAPLSEFFFTISFVLFLAFFGSSSDFYLCHPCPPW